MRAVALLGLASACAADKSSDTGTACVGGPAIVTDIDETLTLSDGEYLGQLADPTYDPVERTDASTLMQRYNERGWRVFYVTARGDELVLNDGRSAQQATEDWLDDHNFPREADSVFLFEGTFVSGDDTVVYKAGVLEGLGSDGWEVGWAYGNAETDTLAWQQHGVPDDHIFLVGILAGTMGVVGIEDEDAYTQHLIDQDGDIATVSGCE
jgi:phosphatidate phosphatase PAH1